MSRYDVNTSIVRFVFCCCFFNLYRQRIPPKNVFYYRCPDHQKNYILSFAFAFDREDDIYQVIEYPLLCTCSNRGVPRIYNGGFLSSCAQSACENLASTPTFWLRPLINDRCFYQRWQQFVRFSTILAGKHQEKHKRRRSRLGFK